MGFKKAPDGCISCHSVLVSVYRLANDQTTNSLSAVRMIGGGCLVAAELITPVNENLYITAIVLESVGLSPLLFATLAFLKRV
jgi:hypothetical protein